MPEHWAGAVGGQGGGHHRPNNAVDDIRLMTRDTAVKNAIHQSDQSGLSSSSATSVLILLKHFSKNCMYLKASPAYQFWD